MKYPDWIYEKIRSELPFNSSALQGLPPVIEEITDLAKAARADGLLAIEDRIEELSAPLLKMGVSLVCDGYDPEIIRTTLTNSLLLLDDGADEFLKRMIIIEGVLGIQSGDNPAALKTALTAFLGEDAAWKMMELPQ